MKKSKRYLLIELCKQKPSTAREIAEYSDIGFEEVYKEISKLINLHGHEFKREGSPARFSYISGPKLKCEKDVIFENVLACLESDNPRVEWLNSELSDTLDLCKEQVNSAIRLLRKKGYDIKTNQYGWGKAGYIMGDSCTTM